MASETEGIALLSMYGDDEEDEEAIAAPPEGEGAGEEAKEISNDDNIRSDRLPLPVLDKSPQILTLPSPIRPKDGADSKTLRSLLPPISTQAPAADRRASRGAVTIVDYAHDEAAMSLETEEEEVEGGDYILIGTELRGSDDVTTVAGHSEGTTPVTSQTLAPNSQYECLQPSDAQELSKTKASMAMDCFETEQEVGEVETYAAISSDLQKDDPLQKFLPPAITIKCSEELQEKINKFLAYKKVGKSFNADLRKKKDYRNPDFLQHAVRYQDIEQIGTCFGTEVIDPLGYDKSDFYDEIEADMKRELEKKAQERKRSQKIDFVSGGVQSGEAAAPALKMNNKIPAVGVSTGVNNELQPVSTTVDAARDIRLNKKSKWDKLCSS